ncbi:MAG: hypothetical protein R3D71_08335 [Rickettsiales bacterium]
MSHSASDHRITRIRVLVLHGLMHRLCLGHSDTREHNTLQQLFDKIDTVSSMDSSRPFLEYERFRRFIQQVVTPNNIDLDIYQAFLEHACYLQQGQLDAYMTNINVDTSTKRNPILALEQIKALEGVYFHEGHADNQALISHVILHKEFRKHHLNILFQECVYYKGKSENVLDYKNRLDHGKHDDERTYLGALECKDDALFLVMRAENNDRISLLLALDEANKRFSIVRSQDLVERFFANIVTHPDHIQEETANLTKRQINNILMNNSRLFNYDAIDDIASDITKAIIKRKLNQISNDYDNALLNAAEDGHPLDMIKALVNGADINAQDHNTGMTSLHYIARHANHLCMEVMTAEKHDVLVPLFQELADAENISVEEIELRYSKAQAKLDPAILNHDYQFASDLCQLARNYKDFCNPIVQLSHDAHAAMFFMAMDALERKGLEPSLVSAPIEARIKEMGLTPLGSKSSPPEPL